MLDRQRNLIYCDCGKRAYTKKEAQTMKNKQSRLGFPVRIYQCNGLYWHLTHKNLDDKNDS